MPRLSGCNPKARSTAFGVVLLLMSCAVVFAQDFQPATTSNAKQFVGTWQASFNGRPFLTLTFAIADNKFTGTASHVDIEVNPAGELTKAESQPGENPITDAQVKGNVLRFTIKNSDWSEDSPQSELRLNGPDKGEIRMIGIPEDVPAPKPWQVTRVSSNNN